MKPRVDSLTGLRGIAALYVMSFHYNYFFVALLHVTPVRFIRMGNLGVDLFFILSGFVLAHVHLNDFINDHKISLANKIKVFIQLRLARIYPLHLITFLAAVILYMAKNVSGANIHNHESYTAIAALANILLVHSWGGFSTLTWNGPSWSISIEWFLYLLFPFLALALGKINKWYACAVAIFSLLSAMCILKFIYHRSDMSASYDYGLIRGTGEFICGICLNIISRKHLAQSFSHSLATTASTFTLLCALIFSNAYVAVFAMAYLIFSLSYQEGYVAKLLSHRICVYLGTISYSLYLWHVLVLNFLFSPMVHGFIKNATSWPAIFLWIISVPLVLLIAHLSYKYFELPARLILRNKIHPKKLYDQVPIS